MIRATNQAAPLDDCDKDPTTNWKYDLYKLAQGHGYISSSFWLGTNGTQMFKSAMMMERCHTLVSAAMMHATEDVIKSDFPDAVKTTIHMVANFQTEEPEKTDRDYQTKSRIWSFQKDIKKFMTPYVLASRFEGKFL